MDALSAFDKYPVICFVGPTASGKTMLAQRFAEDHCGEIISADSMQVYRGMDIGTGKIPEYERSVPYYGLDLCDPGQPYSASVFQEYARSCIAAIRDRNNLPILCGGTGLYIRAAIDDYQFPQGDQKDNPIRDHYTKILEKDGAQKLWDRLQSEDPDSASLIHPNNSRRVIRAFEMIAEGTSYAAVHENYSTIEQVFPVCIFGLEVDPALLIDRINTRVDTMIEEGLVAEVESLLHKGFREALTAGQAIGYKEIVQALEGHISLDEAIGQIKVATRRYAKRQRTWFRKDKRIHWINADAANVDLLITHVESVLATIDHTQQ